MDQKDRMPTIDAGRLADRRPIRTGGRGLCAKKQKERAIAGRLGRLGRLYRPCCFDDDYYYFA